MENTTIKTMQFGMVAPHGSCRSHPQWNQTGRAGRGARWEALMAYTVLAGLCIARAAVLNGAASGVTTVPAFILGCHTQATAIGVNHGVTKFLCEKSLTEKRRNAALHKGHLKHFVD
eukprot:m.313811 g.313811  ORF g.313811 m.313811 type:complete len:117 (+) comp20260_c0_seq3:112-462(+)